MHREQQYLRRVEDRLSAAEFERSGKDQIIYLRKLNRIMAMSIITLAAMLITLAMLLWGVYQDKQINQYLNCVNLAAIGVTEPSCEVYQPFIESQTNAYRRWSQRLRDKSMEEQVERETREAQKLLEEAHRENGKK